MADNKTTVQVDVTSNLDKQVALSEKLKNNLKEAGSGRTTYAQAAAARGVTSAGGQAAEDSNTARGVAGATGAAGRDFAAQARGLGGLVHLYATFAANLFAVSAAFTALNKAANIENMVKGLDQLGASSGKNLGNLAKQVKYASDGALSLAESMSSVAQASSAGIASKNILRMTEVAKKASQALGRDMSDAMSRLSRGITKVEPELLDELGIMVKVDEASRNYARTLGKSALALTDFERRQGYANAVLAEGEKKFGEINLVANPYQKILASITDLAVSAGQSVNRVLGPVLNFLSASPTALGAALTGIVGILLKQAIPALGQFRRNAEAAAATTSGKFISTFKDLEAAASDLDAVAQLRAETRFKNEVANAKRIKEVQQGLTLQQDKSKDGKFAGLMDITKKDPFALTQEDLKLVDSRIKKLSDARSDAYRQDYVNLSNWRDKVVALRADLDSVSSDAENKRVKEDQKLTSHYKQVEMVANRAALSISNTRIKALVAETAATYGTSEALRVLKQEIQARSKSSTQIEVIDPKTGDKLTATLPKVEGFFGALKNGAMFASGALTIATAKVNTLLAAFGPWIQLIALVGAGLGLLLSNMSNNTKEADSYAQSLEALNSSFDNMANTIEKIDNRNPLERISIESISARANAIDDLNNNLAITLARFDKMANARNGWDELANGFWDFFGKGDADKLSKQLSQTIVAAVKGLEGQDKENLKEKVRKIIGIDDINFESINDINSKIKDLDETVIRSKAGEFEGNLKKIAKTAMDSASNLNSFKDTITDLGKEFDKYVVSLKASDPLTKMGEDLISLSSSMSKSMDKPIEQLLLLSKIAEDISTLSLLPPETAQKLIDSNKGLKELNTQLAQQESHIKDLQELYNTTSEKAAAYTNRPASEGRNSYIDEKAAADKLPNIAQQLAAAKELGTSLQADLAKRLKDLSEVNLAIFKKGSELLEQKLIKALAEGALAVAGAYVSALKSAGASTASLEADIQKQEIALQRQDIELRYKQIEAQTRNTLAIERDSNLRERDTLDRYKLETAQTGSIFSKDDEARLKQLNITLSASQKIISALDSNKGITGLYNEAKTKKLAGKASDEDNNILGMAGGLATATIEKASQNAALNAKQAVVAINEQLSAIQEYFKADEETINLDIKRKENLIANLDIMSKLGDEYSVVNDETKKGYELDILKAKNKLEAYKYDVEISKLIAIQNALANRTDSTSISILETAKARLKVLQQTRAVIESTGAEDIIRKQIDNIKEVASNQAKADTEKADRLRKFAEYNNNAYQSSISLSDAELNSQKALGTIYEDNYIQKTSDNELLKQTLSYTIETSKIEDELNIKRKYYADTISKLTEERNKAIDPEKVKLFDDALASVRSEQEKTIPLLEASVNSSAIIYANKIKELQVQRELNLELAEQDKRTKDIVKATTSLALLFGKVGVAIGGVLAVINKMGEREQKYNVQKLRAQKELERYKDDTPNEKRIEATAKAQKELGRIEQDNAIEQMNSISEISAATKEAFAEKTGAYKAFQAIEKAAAAYSLAMQAQQHAQELAALPDKIAGGVSKIFDQLGTYGFPVAAAFLALMASLGASKGGSVSAPPIGNTAEEMQKIQGTGQKYDSKGKLVATGGGVFGDQEAKSESIKNSLEIIKDNTIEGLGYDSKMLKALESIDQGINNTAKSLYNIAGLRSGSITGTQDVSTSSHGIKNLFGSSTTKEIIDSGIELSGTFSQLAKSAKGLVKAYETIRSTKVKSGFFGIGGGTSITDSKNYIGVSTEVENEITAIFKNAADLFTTVGEKIGITAAEVTKKLDSIDIGNAFTSLRGLKGDELEKEFSAVIGSILDNASSTIFASMGKYAKFGEGFLETTIRVVDGFEKVKVDLSSISVSVDKFTYDISEALIKNAGGLDEFTNQLKFFSDNYLTEAEKLVPVQANVSKVLESLGLSSVDTREEFAFVVKSLDLTTKAGQDTYQQLMDIAQAFSEVHSETRVVLSVEERLSQLRSQYVRILELENKKLESVTLARELELEAMDDALKLGAKYIWAMEDELDLKTKLTEAHNNEAAALQTTIDSLTSSIETLKKYEDSLKLGGQSILTPSEKYAEAKSQAEKVAEIASSIATTEAEKRAKNEAISNLPAAAGAFLEASRTLFASSAQYTTDYNTVLALVGSTSTALEAQKSTAEQQLDTLNAQYDSLNIIKDNTATMAELLPQFLVAQQNTLAAMTAYYAAGGPNQGPPLPTNGIDQNTVNASVKLQNDALLKEVQLLNKQIDALRKEQQKQTADLVLAEKAIADAKIAADKAAADAAAASVWAISNSPWYDNTGAWVSTGG